MNLSSPATLRDPAQIKVKGELSPDPNVCKFILEEELLADWTIIFRDPAESLESPLVDELFAVDGVVQVKVSGRTVTVHKRDDRKWPDVARQIVPAIRRVVASGQPAISKAALDAVVQEPADDLAALIEQLFINQVNPALSAHGGFVKLVKVEDRDVYLTLGGGCQGCSASRQTLTMGIENAIRQVAPQVRNIIDTTDHASGQNPYYR